MFLQSPGEKKKKKEKKEKKKGIGWALSDPVPESNRVRKASPVGMPARVKNSVVFVR